MRRIAAGLIVIMSVLLVSCKGKTGNTITVGSDKLDNTQSYFSESMHKAARCDSGYYYLDKCVPSALIRTRFPLELIIYMYEL